MNCNGVIEDLFYGELRPNEMPMRDNCVYDGALHSFCECERWLTEQLEGDSKTKLLTLLNAHSALLGETAYENFRYGFQLGMMLMLEVCEDDI